MPLSESKKPGEKQDVFWTKGTIAFFIGVGVIVLIFLVWVALNWSARAAVERELEKLRAAGQPLTPEEVAPPLVPEAENAAPVFQRAFIEANAADAAVEADTTLGGLKGRKTGYWCDMSFADVNIHRADVRGALEHHARAFPLLDKALALPTCRFDLDYAASFAMELPHLSELRHLARLLKARAFLRTHEGDVAGALRDVERMLRLRHALDDEPLLISRLVRLAIVTMAIDALSKIGEGRPLPEEEAARLVKRLAAVGPWATMHAALVSERAFGMDAVNTVLRGELTPTGSRGTFATRAVASVGGFWMRWNQVAYIELMTEMIDASALPPMQALDAARDIEDRMTKLSDVRGLFAKMMMPALANAMKRTAMVQARAHAAAVGIACRLYERRHGRRPSDLSRLAPEFLDTLPVDAFTNKPLKVAPTANGFVVYSLGPNGVDDGGTPSAPNAYDKDVVWEHRNTPAPAPPAPTPPGASP